MLTEMTATASHRGQNQLRRRTNRLGLIVVMALALIVFVRVDWPGTNIEHEFGSASQPAAAPSDPGAHAEENRRPFVLLASGAYLDSVGQLTNVMNELVNSVLEKVSFLAEVIIESALEEECAAPFVAVAPNGSVSSGASNTASLRSAGPEQVDQKACRRYEAQHNLSRTASKIATTLSKKQPIERIKFDRDEFKNVDLFVSQYLGNGAASGTPLETAGGCKLFTIDINSDDLPADDMGICCGQFHQCYARCSAPKLECDSALRSCLNRVCKANFNYKNETLAREFASQPNGDWPPRKRPAQEEDDEDDNDADDHQAKRAARPRRQTAGRGHDEDMGFEPLADLDEAGQEAPSEGGQSGRRKWRRQAAAQEADGAEVDARTIKRLQDKYKACKLASKLLIIGNLAFGCQNYKRAQWQSCCLGARLQSGAI